MCGGCAQKYMHTPKATPFTRVRGTRKGVITKAMKEELAKKSAPPAVPKTSVKPVAGDAGPANNKLE